MTIVSNLRRIIDAKTAIRQAIVDKGVDIAETDKIDTYGSYIDQISTKPLSDLQKLKKALAAGTAETDYPIGTEISDTYDGHENPLIICQYLDSTNNSSYDGAEGIILQRKYVEPQSMFGSSIDYATSTVNSFLNTTYLNNCTDELRSLISEISIPYRNISSNSIVGIASKFFIPSGVEVMGSRNSGEGVGWDYWKQKTGLSSANDYNNSGRTLVDRTGATQGMLLRSAFDANYACYVNGLGAMSGGYPLSSNLWLLPACFIAKS